MEALEVGAFLLVSGLDQSVESRHHQRRHSTAEHRLFTEEIGFGLLLERGLEHPGPGCTERARIRKTQGLRTSARILMHRYQCRRALPLFIEPAHQMPGRFGSDQHHIDPGRRVNLAIVDVETVREEESLPRSEALRDLIFVNLLLHVIRGEDHDQVRFARGLGDRKDPQPGAFCLLS